MSAHTHFSPWSLSLRELLLLVAIAAFAIVSLKFANDWFWIGLSTAAMLLFMAALIVAFIDRGSRQAFAIGFVLCGGMYAGAVVAATSKDSREFDPYAGSLPTTKLMRPVFEAAVKMEYMVMGSTQTYASQPEAFRASRSNQKLRNAIGNGILGLESPKRENFLGVAHVWWGLLLGYCGGRFAKFVYLRREQRANDTVAA